MNSSHPDWKEKVKHEVLEMTVIAVYLGFFFCALVTYDLLLLRQYHIEFWNYAFAIVNALVITKVIMIGEYAKLGKRQRKESLFIFAIRKAFLFGLLVFVFHVLEEVIKRMIHGEDMTRASRDIRIDQFGGRAIIIICVFITLFAFREIRRVMGEDEFWSLVFRRDGDGFQERKD
jgi:hypothetical protein